MPAIRLQAAGVEVARNSVLRPGASQAHCYHHGVGRDLFLTVLALATVLCGLFLLVLLYGRRAQHRRRVQQGLAKRPRAASKRAASAGRLIDEYAQPTPFDSVSASPSDDVESKICPVCGARYGGHFRYCERDDSELATLN